MSMTDKLKFEKEAKPRRRHEKVADFAVVRKTDADPHVNHFWQPCCGAGWWIRDSVPQEKLLEGQPGQNKEQFETERCTVAIRDFACKCDTVADVKHKNHSKEALFQPISD